MPLHGSLNTFPPSEIFQFLSQSRKTGTLRVFEKAETKLMSFAEGQLCYAVHVRGRPRISDLIMHRNLATLDEVAQADDDQEMRDNLISRAQARRRLSTKPFDNDTRVERHRGWRGRSRIGSILAARGSLREEDLQRALTPAEIPAPLLEAMIKGSGKVASRDLATMRSGTIARAHGALHQALVSAGLLTSEDLDEIIAEISEESLAELLLYHELVGKTELRRCLDQLEKLRGSQAPKVRFGGYLVAKGKITRRQLERALESQLLESCPLGEVLVGQGALTEGDLMVALDEIDRIRMDFGLLYPMREKLVERQLLTEEVFMNIVSELKLGDTLSGALVGTEIDSEDDMRMAIKDILVDEICDLLLWKDASFEFFEGFSLEDAFSADTLPRIHDGAFEVNSLLLDAHSSIDERRRTRFAEISPATVFIEVAHETAVAEYEDILRSLTGTRALRELEKVLPGNHYAHLCQFTNLLEEGHIRPLTRKEAADAGREAVRASRSQEAIDLLEHALGQPGDEPTNSALRKELHELRLQTEPRFFRFVLLKAKTRFRQLSEKRWCRAAVNWVDKSPWRKKAAIGIGSAFTSIFSAISYVVLGIPSLWNRGRALLEIFLIRIGAARHIWSFEAKYIKPLQRFVEEHGFPARNRRIVYMLGILAVILLIATPGVVDEVPIEVVRRQPTTDIAPPNLLVHSTDSRIDTPPCVVDKHVYLSTRNAELRSLKLTAAENGSRKFELRSEWQLEIGDFGDVLTEPVVHGDSIYVANICGRVLRVSRQGEALWQRDLPRVEPLRPSLLVANDGGLAGVAVASRSEILVLKPEDGKVLFRFDTGNRILCPPVGKANLLVIGSSDNHIYGIDWEQGLLLWDHEASDDITSILWMDELAVFAARDGRVAAVNVESGEPIWSLDYARNSITWLGRLDEERICVVSEGGQVQTLASDTGEKLISFSAASTGSRFEAGCFYFSKAGVFGAMDRRGKLRWRTKLPIRDVSGWAIGDGFSIVVGVDGNLGLFALPETAVEAKK